MFTPSQLEQMPIEIERIMSAVEQRIMEDIIRRININDEITRSADWQIYRLKMIGQSDEFIRKQIQTALKLSEAEIQRLYDKVIQSGYARDNSLYEAVGKPQIPFKDNEQLQQLIQSVIAQTQTEMVNITQSMGFAIDIGNRRIFTPMAEYYQQILDRAIMEVTTGEFDYNATLRRTIHDMTKSGIRGVGYPTGHRNRIVVAARRALMTGITQVVSHINDSNAQELDTEYFEVSWHGTARPSHQAWQGRVYSRQDLVSICGLGTGPGLMGWNCYHTYYPFIPGVSERTYTDAQLDKMNQKENEIKTYNDKKYNRYEATQRQRELETLMRKQRQEIDLLKKGGATEDDLINARAKYRSTMAQYTNFSTKMDLPQQRERVYMDGLGRV